MQRTLKLILAYDGADFHGWQRQADVRTVQGDVEQVMQRLLRAPTHVIGASRTDAGVHARGQTAHLVTESDIPDERVARALASRLPEDIALVSLERAPDGFHAIRDARCKLYRYRVYNSLRRPVEDLAQRYAWHVWYDLEDGAMAEAAALLVGTQDFAAFAGAGCQRETTVRTVYRADVQRVGREVRFEFEGDGFLYNQVRNMVGTLIEVGRGHWRPGQLREILASGDRARAGPTAPPHGLCLEWIRYPERGAAEGAGGA
jgi:tRNA pseudouridine38-40 synthase